MGLQEDHQRTIVHHHPEVVARLADHQDPLIPTAGHRVDLPAVTDHLRPEVVDPLADHRVRQPEAVDHLVVLPTAIVHHRPGAVAL